jgi:hypothetical protein
MMHRSPPFLTGVQRLPSGPVAGSALLLLCLTLGCGPSAPATPAGAPPPPPWFRDVTEESGIDFVHDAGPTGQYFLPQLMGSGAALFDFDNDGRLDAYLVQNAGPDSGATNRLFHQEPDGTFRDVSAGSGLDVAGHGMGVAIGDVNNDGLPDVLLTEYGRTRLFLNNGNGTFTDVTRESGLDSSAWGASASFFDYDRDGWLDLVVVNYVSYDPSRECAQSSGQRDFCVPHSFTGTVTRLFRNLGPKAQGKAGGVRFEDVTMSSGIGRVPGPGLGVYCADFDGDGWPDIFVANDAQPNRLWINQKDGTFKEEAARRGIAYDVMGKAAGNMGVAVGDVDGNGLFDVFVTHLTEENHTLWAQERPGQFRDRTAAAGLTNPGWHGTGFGTVLADFNHDGAPDLAIVNGRVSRGPGHGGDQLAPFWRPYAERNQLFANDGGGRFRDLSATDPFGALAAVSRGLACGDVNGDGALDLLVTAVAGRARLYRNVAPKAGHWLMVRAVDPAHKRDAYGAVVTVSAGGHRWLSAVNPGHSYLCSNDVRAHFGLGPAERVDSIRVRWPDGDLREEVFAGGSVDRIVLLRRGEGQLVSE